MRWAEGRERPWRWKFALIPVYVLSEDGGEVLLWLEWYQSRRNKDASWCKDFRLGPGHPEKTYDCSMAD